jgi:hypothetical protein
VVPANHIRDTARRVRQRTPDKEGKVGTADTVDMADMADMRTQQILLEADKGAVADTAVAGAAADMRPRL